MLAYKISAKSVQGETAFAEASGQQVFFDGTAQRNERLPSPAELLLCSLSACMLKNVERFSEILKFEYKEVSIDIIGKRNDAPPFISEINYLIKIKAELEERTLQLLHKNILKHGTITNTLSKVAKLNGSIKQVSTAI